MVISGVKVSVILLIFLNERGRYNRQHAVRYVDFIYGFIMIYFTILDFLV